MLIFSQRNLNRLMYQCFIYEFEDVVGEIDRVDLLAPASLYTTEVRQLAHRVRNTARKSVGMLPVGDIEPITVERDYDLFFAVFQFPWQAIYLNRLKGWRKRCGKAACFLAEAWTTMLSTSREYYLLLAEVDYIFTHSEVSAAALSDLLGRKCYCLPFGVDAERFCPYPAGPERSIDLLSIGRTSPDVHKALLRISADLGLFYHFDTAQNFQVRDYIDHRLMLAELLKRSRFTFAYKHNVNMTRLTGGDEALAPRFFEAAAAGSVILGMPPDCDEFRACFDWKDAVIGFPYDTGGVQEILSALIAQPERLVAASLNNVGESLKRHDWAHRWRTVLTTAGLASEPAMKFRLEQLNCLAERICVDGSVSRPLLRPHDAVAQRNRLQTRELYSGSGG
ncbi:MAG TPA: glycosyltransferase [Bryobacteraceae bacterium]|nr:glycosyltransferase [Bryobacteraceae bacterium]